MRHSRIHWDFPIMLTAFTSLLLICLINMTSASPLHHDDDIRTANHKAERQSNPRPSLSRLSDKSSSNHAVQDCPKDHYYSGGDLICRPCSMCPVNQIIRRPCTAHLDTLCGPFVEFDQFQQRSNPFLSARKIGASVRHQLEQQRQFSMSRGHPEGWHSGSQQQGVWEEETGEDLASLASVETDSHWHVLPLALIVILIVVCCALTVIGLRICLTYRRSLPEKQVIRQPVFYDRSPDLDEEPRYIETYVTSAGSRWKTSRHPPLTYQTLTCGDTSAVAFLTSTSLDSRKKPSDREVDEYVCLTDPVSNTADS